MRNRIALGFALAAVLLLALPGFTQSKPPDFSGEWRMGAAGTTATALSIVQNAAQITVKDGSSTRLYKLDGSLTPYNLDGTPANAGTKPGDAPVTTKATWKGSTLTLTVDASNGDRPFTVVDVYTLGADGKTLTRNRTTTIADQGPTGATKETTTFHK